MVEKKDPICLTLVVIKHNKSETIDKNTVYTVSLKGKVSEDDDFVGDMRIKSTDSSIFDELPLKSERKIQLLDEQTTLT